MTFIEEWIICPVCDSDDIRFSGDCEHLVVECGNCLTSVKEHYDGMRNWSPA